MKRMCVLWTVGAAALFALLASCAGTPAAVQPAEGLGEPGPLPTRGINMREVILIEGERFIDTPYQSPPSVPERFDCSGFINYLFGRHASMSLPSSSGAYLNVGEAIDFKDAEPGDILIFTSTPGGRQVNHVAILYKKSATRELRGSLLLHAISIPTQSATIKGTPDTTGVKISELGRRADGKWQQEYFLSRFHSVRRVIR